MTMSKIPAGRFKAECLALMDRVRERQEEYVVTKHGTPVAKLVPVGDTPPRPLFGCMRGTVRHVGDLVGPIDVRWDADEADGD